MLNYWSLNYICRIVGGIVVGNGNIIPTSLSLDTRSLKCGDVFIAIRDRRDGHLFVFDAVAKGAVALIVDHYIPLDIPQLVVYDTLLMLQNWGRAKLQKIGTSKILAITGSVGKTSIKNLLASATSAWKTPGNMNSIFGIPEVLSILSSNVNTVVFEIGISRPGEMEYITNIINPGFALITNIGTAHIENFFDGQYGIAMEKGMLIKKINHRGAWAYLVEDKWCKWLALKSQFQHIDSIAVGFGCKYYWDRVESKGSNGVSFIFNFPGGELPVKLKLRGLHQVRNATLAGALAIRAGFDAQNVVDGMMQVELEPGRGKIYTLPDGGYIIDETYNASYDSVIASISCLIDLNIDEPIVILGCMMELGSHARLIHVETGLAIKKLGVKRLLVYGTYAHDCAKGFGVGSVAFADYEDLSSNVNGLLSISGKDCVLVKGSRYWKAERVVNWLLANFSVKL